MEGFTVVDAVVAAVVVISAILAYSRGFVREAMAILGWIAAAVVAYILAPQVEPLVKEIPVLNTILGDSCELAIIAAFAGVFAIALVVASLFTPLFSGIVQRSPLGGVDRGLGFLFGVARGVILVAIALVVYDRAIGGAGMAAVDDSRSAQVFGDFQDNLGEQIPADAPGWLVARYEGLMQGCGVVEAAPGSSSAGTTPADTTATDPAAAE